MFGRVKSRINPRFRHDLIWNWRISVADLFESFALSGIKTLLMRCHDLRPISALLEAKVNAADCAGAQLLYF